jgi:hypothetical protein
VAVTAAVLPRVAPEVPLDTEVEALAAEWVRPYDQVEHLMRARDWVVHLEPDASVEMRVAAMTHDIERMFPGGPTLRHADGDWDSPFYLFPHSLRSSEAVGVWLESLGPVSAQVSTAEVRRLIALHEVGGLRGADVVQAADSLSYLETLAGLTRRWVLNGTCSREAAAGKLRYSVDRIRVAAALQPAGQLLAWALDQLPAGDEVDAMRGVAR